MAEEIKTDSVTPSEDKIADLIKQNVTSSMSEAMKTLKEEYQPHQQVNTTQVNTPAPGDWWSDIIDPKVDAKTAKATLTAEIAQDKVDFYSSDEWLEEVDEYLVSEDATDRKAEKKALREDLEKKFENLVKQGRGMPRADIFKAVLGEKLKKDKVKYEESFINRNNKKKALELENARRGVDIGSGNISNFTPADIHAMPVDKMLEEFGNMSF